MTNRAARTALAAAHNGNRPHPPRVAVAPAEAPEPPDPAIVMNQLATEAQGVYAALQLRGLPDVLAAALAAHLVVEPARRRGLQMPSPPRQAEP